MSTQPTPLLIYQTVDGRIQIAAQVQDVPTVSELMRRLEEEYAAAVTHFRPTLAEQS